MNETTIEITPGAIRAHYARRNLDAPTSFDMAGLAKAAIWFRELKAADELLRLIEEGWTSAEIEAGELRHDGSMITNAGQGYRPPPPALPPGPRPGGSARPSAPVPRLADAEVGAGDHGAARVHRRTSRRRRESRVER